MFRTAAPARRPFGARLKIGTSLTALALAVSLAPLAAPAARAQTAPQPFGTMVGMQAGRVTLPNGQLSQWTGARAPVIGTDTDGRPLMTIEQTQAKALLDWEDFRLKTNEVLEFKQQSADWIAVNRVHGNQAAEINGEIRAIGKVFVFNDNGVLIGKDAKINTRTLVTGRGFSDVLIDGKTTTLVQSKEKALLNWSDMSTQAGEVLRFQQEKSNWLVLNRSLLTGRATELKGDIKADGHVLLVSREGLHINGKIDAHQVVASALDIRDVDFLGDRGLVIPNDANRFAPTFSNSWNFAYTDYTKPNPGYNLILTPPPPTSDPNDPLRYKVTVGTSGVISTGSFGKVMLFGPHVTNKGIINIKDEGQVVLAAGDNIYLEGYTWEASGNGKANVYTGAFNPYNDGRINVPFDYPSTPGSPWLTGKIDANWQEIIRLISGKTYQDFVLNTTGEAYDPVAGLSWSQRSLISTAILGARFGEPGLFVQYINRMQGERVHAVNFTARNEGIISSKRGGNVDFRGWNLEQMGAIEMTSTTQFRSNITFTPVMYDYKEYANAETHGPWAPSNGTVTFGKGSLTQITPDLDSTDSIPVDSGDQSVGTLKINARSVHMQEDALIYLPSGEMTVLLDAANPVFSNRGPLGNTDNEDGTRFLMDRGATIDLSGWETTLGMGFHQVTGKLFAAQLKDSPLQRDGVLYRKEISVDRRFGTNLADWSSFDNLSKGTLAQFLIDGGTFSLDVGDDFIMKAGSVIDVSGGKVTYKDGYVYTTMLRRLDGSVIDIREADPDELYMGLANEWTVYDTKWGKQQSYYIPLMSASRGRYETSYEHGGKGGKIEILAPDAVLQGTVLGHTTAGRYQRNNLPKGGAFIFNNAGKDEKEYVGNTVLIASIETLLSDKFGMNDMLSDTFGGFFGVEFDRKNDEPGLKERRFDNATLASDDFFNRSTMGSYALYQDSRIDETSSDFPPLPGYALTVEAGVQLNLQNGADLTLAADQRLLFAGKVRTEGGDVTLRGEGLVLGDGAVIDTRGSWYSDFELDEPVALTYAPRIDGGNVSLQSTLPDYDNRVEDIRFIVPDSVTLDMSGGAWVDRNGKLTAGKGGDLSVLATMLPGDETVLGGVFKARAYGLGGNGKFSLSVYKDIYIGDALPDTTGAADSPLLFTPDFFQNSGFSSVALTGNSITVVEGTQIKATSASLQLRNPTLNNGVPSAYYAPSGTDIYDIAQPIYMSPELRHGALRNGMNLTLTAGQTPDADGHLVLDTGTLLSTEIGGQINLYGNTVDLHGTVAAPAGSITVQAPSTGDSRLTVHNTARLLAPGAVLITSRVLNSEGGELVEGEIRNGGHISLNAMGLTIEEGAVLDVSGVKTVFDIARVENGVRLPVNLASDGGTITLSGQRLDVDRGTYRAHSGGAGARGGRFEFNWAASFGAKEDTGNPSLTPTQVVDQLEQYAEWGYFYDKDFNQVTSLYGVDLSTIMWDWVFGYSIDFPPGFTISSREELIKPFNAYTVAALGKPPLLRVGNSLPPIETGGPAPLPEINPGLMAMFTGFGYQPPEPSNAPPAITNLSVDRIAQGGFSELSMAANPGILFIGDVVIGGRHADGSAIFDRIDISAPMLMGQGGADVRIDAGIISTVVAPENLGAAKVDFGLYREALGEMGIHPVNADSKLVLQADILMDMGPNHFYGFSDVLLSSGGDLRLRGFDQNFDTKRIFGELHTAGNLTLKADQVYAVSTHEFTVRAGQTLTILPQDAGTKINVSPYEAGAILNLIGPRIVQGGTIRSPLGTINITSIDDGTEGANTVTLLPGSLTSVSADGKVIPYGVTSNGDTWIDPVTGLELTSLPTKAINLTADVLDLQEGAVLDVKGGGDLYAYEFTPGIGGSTNWLTGYRDENYKWVADASQIYAVIPGYDADIAPIGLGGGETIGVGEKVYLSGGSGLEAGYYTLLPASYAILPGAFRVTTKHHYGNYSGMALGQSRNMTDGSSIQAGYRFVPNADGAPKYMAQRTDGFLVMPGSALRLRSQYLETSANTFYLSDAFLKKALRTNRPVGEVPRIPLDGGSVVLDAGSALKLDATLRSAAAKGGRGGFADIKGEKILVAGAGTDLSQYDGYLVLDSDRLNSFGAESLLLGGVRKQGAVNLEIQVGATDIVIDNKGSVLYGPELLFTSTGDIDVKTGARLETRGQISGSSGDLRILPAIAPVIDDKGNNYPGDDVVVHAAIDQGAVLRLSSSEQVDILRNIDAVDTMAALAADPAALAAHNAKRAEFGLPPITVRGQLTIADNAVLISSRSLALDATNDTRLASGATLTTKQISASASRVSVGNVPAGTAGLVFAGGSLGALANAEDILLKSYSSIDFHGAATLRANGSLALDSRNIRILNANGGTVTVAGNALTLTNTSGGTATAATGNAKLLLEGKNIYFEGQGKWLSGADTVTVKAAERIIGRDMGTLYIPGALDLQAADLTADSGAQLFLDAQGAVRISSNGNTSLPAFETLGATLSVTGSSIVNEGRIGLTGGIVNLRARQGNVVLANGSSIDVTSKTSQIFDIQVGVGGGTVNLTSDRGDVDMAANARIDVSGTAAGGDAGTLNVSAGLGNVKLAGQVKGDAKDGFRSGSFSSLSLTMADFVALNSQLDAGGFRQARHFEVNSGDITVSGTVRVNDFAVVANDGSILVNGTVETLGGNGGRIQLSAAKNVTLASGSRLLAAAKAADGSGGTVFLETVGKDGGRLTLASGSLINVSGTGEGGRSVRLRAPQINGGTDLAIDRIEGTITGARSVVAEGFRVYDGVTVIDQPVITQVSADATAFMTHAGVIQNRLGSGVTVAPGIELRSDGDMELKTDWDLHGLRFGSDQSAGVLTLRAKGDILINANLSDGFNGSTASADLINGNSWSFNLTAGANTTSPNSLAVLPQGLLDEGKGSIIVGGTPDTLEYYRVAISTGPLAGTVENRLYLKGADGSFLRDGDEYNPFYGFYELERDAVTGLYIDPATGQPIQKDPVTGDYVDTARYGRRPLPMIAETTGGYNAPNVFGEALYSYQQDPRYGNPRNVQWDNSTGYLVRTGTGAINLASGRDIVLKYRPSVIYTAGQSAAALADFHAPTRLPLSIENNIWESMKGYYTEKGGDILIRAQGDIIGSGSNQLPTGWLWRYGGSTDPNGNVNEGDPRVNLGRTYDQYTWFVRFDHYQAGVGALGGGNVDIEAGGDITNLTVNLPNTGRVSGGYDGIARELHLTGGGDLNLRAGGNIGSGNFYVADGEGNLTAGGAFTATNQLKAFRQVGFQGYMHRSYDIHTMLFTSAGHFRLQSGGDLNLETVADPFNMEAATENRNGGGGRYGPDNTLIYIDTRYYAGGGGFHSYTPDASVDLFSAGGDVKIWNNYGNVGVLNKAGGYLEPLTVYTYNNSESLQSTVSAVWPANVRAVAAAGNVEIKGGMVIAPSPTGNLELLARRDVLFGQTTQADDPFAWLNQDANNYFPGFNDIFMSQTLTELMPTALNVRQTYGSALGIDFLRTAGFTKNGLTQPWTEEFAPDLHKGDTNPVRIYAAEGDVVTTQSITLPKHMWVQAGNHVYFPTYSVQHNNPNDLTLVRAGNGLYFTGDSTIAVYGPGRLEIETGRDFWIPSNGKGITSGRISLASQIWHPNEKAADIAISTGFNQTPDYQGFEDAYLNPEKIAEMEDFLLAEGSDGQKRPIYLFDRVYARGNGAESAFVSPEMAEGFVNYVRDLQGLTPLENAADQASYLATAWDYWLDLPAGQATPYDALIPRTVGAGAQPEFYLPEAREGLVNYVRRLQGLEPLKTQAQQEAYLDTAWTYWKTLGTDFKTPLYRNAFFMELRTTGREANDPDNDRYNTTFRGYDAIATLFPGAEKRSTEALAEGESRWQGDFETFASRVISGGGGDVEFVIPGGAFRLANVAATPGETGQPWANSPRGDALRAGIVSQDGGEVNLFSGGSAILNESRILTTKGGNVMVWSSYGDIAAGKGAKTSITPQFYDYTLSNTMHMTRIPVGLPTGAGIGTLASQPGTAAADVDLIAPNGIVDAGDAGIRVSGNFNVFAIQILGTDNIEVAGISTGLPVPPAAPPTSLDIDVSSRSNLVDKALQDAVSQVQKNKGIVSPSLIEVRSANPETEETCGSAENPCPPAPGEVQPVAEAQPGEAKAVARVAVTYPEPRVEFSIAPQKLDDAIRSVGRASGFNILYDSTVVSEANTSGVSGKMTAGEALARLLNNQNIVQVRVGPRTIMLKKSHS